MFVKKPTAAATQKETAGEKKNVDKDYPLTHVPAAARSGLVAVTGVLIGFTFFTPTMGAGAQIGEAFAFKDLMFILLAGSLILGVYVALICAIGAETGLTAVLLSKYTLGSIGAKWADIALGGTQVLWYAINAEYMGSLFSQALGLEHMKIFFMIFWAVVMGITAIYGFKSMTIVSYAAMPLMIVLVGIVTVLGFRKVGGFTELFAMRPENVKMSVTMAITVVVGTFASGGTQASNWSRFAKNGKIAFTAGLIAFLIGNGIMVFSGMIGGFAFHTGDLIGMMITMGLTFWALIILTLNIWTTNNAAAYAYGVAGAEMFNKNNKTPFIVGGIFIACIVAVIGIGALFIPMLNIFGTFIPPLGGVVIGDYFFVWKRKIPHISSVSFRKVRVSPLCAYIAGCAVAYITGIYEIGIPSMQGILVAVFAVPLFNAILKALNISDMHRISADAQFV
jgi:cytosine permease